MIWAFPKRGGSGKLLWTKNFCCQNRGKGDSFSNPEKPALEQSRVVGHHTTGTVYRKQGESMIRLVSLMFFLGCALMVAHYYGLGSMVQLLGAVAVALGLMRVLSSKRIH
jgi:hypothetical protein